MTEVVFTELAKIDLLDIEYYIFYYYDEQCDIVYIIRVLYNKVDWQSLLKR